MEPPDIRDEHGLTLVELVVVAGLFMVVLGIVGTILWAAFRTASGTQEESQATQEARLALSRLERDIRGAQPDLAVECNFPDAPEGYCLQLWVQLGDRSDDRVRYRMENVTSDGQTRTVLFRDTDCVSDYSSCSQTEVLIGALENRLGSSSVEAFECIALPNEGVRVEVHLLVGPLRTFGGSEGGTLEMDTAATARNLDTC